MAAYNVFGTQDKCCRGVDAALRAREFWQARPQSIPSRGLVGSAAATRGQWSQRLLRLLCECCDGGLHSLRVESCPPSATEVVWPAQLAWCNQIVGRQLTPPRCPEFSTLPPLDATHRYGSEYFPGLSLGLGFLNYHERTRVQNSGQLWLVLVLGAAEDVAGHQRVRFACQGACCGSGGAARLADTCQRRGD